jgi:hypothetical protein
MEVIKARTCGDMKMEWKFAQEERGRDRDRFQ